MSKGGPDLRKHVLVLKVPSWYMDKRLTIKLNANRKVTGVLRGFDQFMNLVLENAVEEVSATEKHEIGMIVIRGNSVVLLEPLEKV